MLATVLLVLTACDLAVEHWLKKRIGPANDALAADPARMVIAAKVRAQLTSEFKREASRKDAVERYRLNHSIGKAR